MRALDTPPLDCAEMRRELAAIVADHREALISNPPESRDLLKMLIEDRLVAHPIEDGEWELRGTGTLEPLVIRAAQNLASQSIPSWNQIASFLESMRQLRDSSGFAA